MERRFPYRCIAVDWNRRKGVGDLSDAARGKSHDGDWDISALGFSLTDIGWRMGFDIMKNLNNLHKFCLAFFCLSLVQPSFGSPEIKKLEHSGDVRALTNLLRHPDGRERASAAVSLSNAIRNVKDPKVLSPLARPQLEAALRDPYQTVREHAGRAFQHSIRNTEDVATLRWVVAPLVDSLHGKEVAGPTRRFASVMLTDIIPRIQHKGILEQSVPRLLEATLKDPSEQVREYAGRSLKSAVLRIQHTQILHDTAVALVNTLEHEDVKRRGYAAVLLSSLVP